MVFPGLPVPVSHIPRPRKCRAVVKVSHVAWPRPVSKIRILLRPSTHVCIQAPSEKPINLPALLATLSSQPESWCFRCKPTAIREIQQQSFSRLTLQLPVEQGSGSLSGGHFRDFGAPLRLHSHAWPSRSAPNRAGPQFWAVLGFLLLALLICGVRAIAKATNPQAEAEKCPNEPHFPQGETCLSPASLRLVCRRLPRLFLQGHGLSAPLSPQWCRAHRSSRRLRQGADRRVSCDLHSARILNLKQLGGWGFWGSGSGPALTRATPKSGVGHSEVLYLGLPSPHCSPCRCQRCFWVSGVRAHP